MVTKKASTAFVNFTTRILKFGQKGEKSGWSYIEIPADVVNKLLPGNKKSFRVKGQLDDHKINGVALMPMGDGTFILAVNASMRKGIGKREGAMLKVQLEVDLKERILNKELMECMEDDAEALAFFNKLPKSHQHYFSKWIDGAKNPETKANRIARTLNALSRKMHYGQMLRAKL